MRKMCLVLLVCLMAGGIWAYQPAGWLYFDWPYGYPINEGAWYYINEPCAQWSIGVPGGSWQYMDKTEAASGWNYYEWPYCYSINGGGWFYMDEFSAQWCLNMNTLTWSKFGHPDPSPNEYLVIDLSGGPSAASYPVSYLHEAPYGGWSDEYKTAKLVLRRILHGTMAMGSPTGELGREADETQHSVTLTRNFYIGVFEVTQKQWERVMGTWPSYFNNAAYRDSRPVEQVSYDMIRGSNAGAGWPANNAVDANSFMGFLRAKTSSDFDLPTEAQWELACRAGTATALNSGNDLTNETSDVHMDVVGRYWFNGGSAPEDQDCPPSDCTATVGTYLLNSSGLYDMHGNVWEICLDWYGAYSGAEEDPKGASSGTTRVMRGGCWRSNSHNCRSASRDVIAPVYPAYDLGFRVALPIL